MSSTIKLIELANTWQGEGPDTGRQMLISRFKKCNLRCSFCDTAVKMNVSIEGSYTIDDINKALEKTKGLMITGGEPTFDENLDQTIMMLRYCNYQIANVETNGCRIEELLNHNELFIQSSKDIRVMYSPKVFNANAYEIEIDKIKRVIDNDNVYLKIVADGNDWSTKLIEESAILSGNNRSKIYLMPLGHTKEEIVKSWDIAIELADRLNLNLSSRMHIMNDFI